MQKEISPVQSLGVIGVVIAICVMGISYVMQTHDKVMITNSIKSFDQIKFVTENLIENTTGLYSQKICHNEQVAKYLKNAASALGYDINTSIIVDNKDGQSSALVAQDEQVTCSQSSNNDKYVITADMNMDSDSVDLYCVDSNNNILHYDSEKDALPISKISQTFSCL